MHYAVSSGVSNILLAFEDRGQAENSEDHQFLTKRPSVAMLMSEQSRAVHSGQHRRAHVFKAVAAAVVQVPTGHGKRAVVVAQLGPRRQATHGFAHLGKDKTRNKRV